MVRVTGGDYIPLYGRDSAVVHVDDLMVDVYPVKNEQYSSYLKEVPKWQRDNTKRIFADERYLSHWTWNSGFSDKTIALAPVTNVSWFAAKNYCAYYNKRLPTVDEWEYSAMANRTLPDARIDSTYNQTILAWYETPHTFRKEVGSTEKNYWGIYDLHGLVWEWTSDFSSVMISGESRKDGATDRNLFCAAGSVNATDLMNYAAFMRYAFRGSIKANYCIKNLGFRCVKDVEAGAK